MVRKIFESSVKLPKKRIDDAPEDATFILGSIYVRLGIVEVFFPFHREACPSRNSTEPGIPNTQFEIYLIGSRAASFPLYKHNKIWLLCCTPFRLLQS